MTTKYILSIFLFLNTFFSSNIAIDNKNDDSSKQIEKTSKLYERAIYSKKREQYIKAIILFDELLKNTKSKKLIIKTHYQLGRVYQILGDIENSIIYYNLVIKKLDKKYNKSNQLYLIYSYINNATNYIKINKIVKSNEYCNKAELLYNNIELTISNKFTVNKTIANVYNQIGNLDINKSLFYLNRALQNVKKNDTIKKNNIYRLMGNLFNTTNANKSLYYLNKIVLKDKDSINKSFLAYNYVLTYDYKKNYNECQKYINSSLSLLNINNLKTNNYKLYLSKINNKRVLLKFFAIYGKVYLNNYFFDKNLTHLKKSLHFFKMADYLLDEIKSNSHANESLLFWRDKSSLIYDNAIEVCFLLNNIEDAFYFTEKNKTLLLLENINKQHYKEQLKIPYELLEKENTLTDSIIAIKNKNHSSKTILKLKRKLALLQDSIYQKKYLLFNKNNIVNLEDLQKKISQKEMVLEYNISDNAAYLLAIKKNKKEIIKLKNLDSIRRNIYKLSNLIKHPFQLQKDKDLFTKLSNKLYNQLIPNVKVENKIKIVLDNFLINFPFEILIDNNGDYLLRNDISYDISESFKEKASALERKPTKNLLAFAPITFNNNKYEPLFYSNKEVLNASTFFYGEKKTSMDATKLSFLNNCNKFNIIHLATHAESKKNEEPWISFYDKKILLNKLLIIQIQADLVVLSACNTSIGNFYKGEGVSSLTRGFFTAGAKTVVSSLWNVNDKSTTYIMTNFYKNLKNGQTKSKALQLAKIDYLNTHSLSEASPYYWASFILIGDSGKLHQIPNPNYWYYYLLGFLVAFAIIMAMAFIKRLQRRATFNNMNAKSFQTIAK